MRRFSSRAVQVASGLVFIFIFVTMVNTAAFEFATIQVGIQIWGWSIAEAAGYLISAFNLVAILLSLVIEDVDTATECYWHRQAWSCRLLLRHDVELHILF